jgi:two-component system OmpR family sensor kinase
MILKTEVDEMKEMATKFLQGSLQDIDTLYCTYKYSGDNNGLSFWETYSNDRTFFVVQYNGVEVKRDITYQEKLLQSISILMYLFSFAIVIITYIYSKMLSVDSKKPIRLLNRYLKNINEKSIRQIPKRDLPEDFHLLVDTLNELFNRIDSFIKYQNELFIGASHELKTPLAVMKLKNQVTLMKPRMRESYIETLRLNISEVEKMTKVIEDLLKFGRQKSAQFEQPIEIDLIAYLKKRGEDFKLLANSQNKNLLLDLQPESFFSTIQETMLSHIIQNFLQNGLKFSRQNDSVILRSRVNSEDILTIEVIDSGIGIDEQEDIFAPFYRKGNKSGIGLGLFLAKSASDTMGAEISIKNRTDGKSGAIATVKLKRNMICLI